METNAKGELPSTLERRLQALRDLPPNWDGMDAEPPSTQAIDKAVSVVVALLASGASADDIEIDADVLGGVAVWFYPPKTGGSAIWIACMNSGSCTATFKNSEGSNIFNLPLFASATPETTDAPASSGPRTAPGSR